MYRKKNFSFSSGIQRLGKSFPNASLVSHFLSFSSILLTAKHPSKDDNLEDG